MYSKCSKKRARVHIVLYINTSTSVVSGYLSGNAVKKPIAGGCKSLGHMSGVSALSVYSIKQSKAIDANSTYVGGRGGLSHMREIRPRKFPSLVE